MHTLARILLVFVVAFAGWIGGSLYPAPAALIAKVSPQALALRAQGDLAVAGVNWNSIQSLVGKDQAERLSGEALRLAQQAGNAIKIEHVTDEETKAAEEAEQWMPPTAAAPVTTQSAPVPTTPSSPTQAVSPAVGPTGARNVPKGAMPAPPPPVVSALPPPSSSVTTSVSPAFVATTTTSVHGGFEPLISLCPGMTITNAPSAETDRRIENFVPLVNVNGVVIAVDPIREACLSSGFGDRHGHLHKGIDFYNGMGGPILAAADGVIVEMKFRDDYGNMLLIDHGHGVYTRYAHLSSFHTGLAVGGHVHAGDEIGLMGNTAGYPVPLHLHYELLLGDYKNPKASFGLVPHSPFEYHAAL